MLTIHTPIELTVNPSILQLNENFMQRLTGNYQVIGSGLEMEDMVHFISSPPEVYLAEGGMTALIENKNIQENQNLKLDVINNVLNRILVSDTYQMTYQDQVFVESVLKKLGVNNVTEFIRQVQNIQQESKNINHLTDLYWSEKESFSELVEYRQMQARKKEAQTAEEAGKESENVLWLHQDILNRLQTGAIYQEVRNYLSTSANKHETITHSEMQVSEQTITAQNILLNKLRNYTMLEEQPLVYHHVNAYEMGDEINNYEDNRTVSSQMVQAVLLNALHQMYALRIDELMRQENVWYQLAGAVYHATENTLQRFGTYHNQYFLTEREADIYSKQVQQHQKNEIQAIQQMFDNRMDNSVYYEQQGLLPREELLYLQEEGEEEDQAGLFSQTGQVPHIQNIQRNELYEEQIEELTRQNVTLNTHLDQIRQSSVLNQTNVHQHNSNREEYTLAGRREDYRTPETSLVHTSMDEVVQDLSDLPISSTELQTIQNLQQTEVHGQQIQSLTKQEILLKNQLEQINQNNINNQQLLNQLNIQTQRNEQGRRINRGKAMEDALRVLSEPEEVLLTYLENPTVVEKQAEIEKENLTRIFGKETIKIFETLENIQRAPQRMERLTSYGQGEASLLRDIRLQEQAVQMEMTHKTQELVQDTVHEIETRQLFREYLPEQVRQTNREMQRRIERVEMVYKQEENTLEEEMLEEIRSLHQTNRVINEQTTEHIIEKNTTQEIINSRVNEFQTRQNEEIVRMITDKMQQQLGSISEQVYGKLEKRMDTERRRRGL